MVRSFLSQPTKLEKMKEEKEKIGLNFGLK
jgi:hypothetical protein